MHFWQNTKKTCFARFLGTFQKPVFFGFFQKIQKSPRVLTRLFKTVSVPEKKWPKNGQKMGHFWKNPQVGGHENPPTFWKGVPKWAHFWTPFWTPIFRPWPIFQFLRVPVDVFCHFWKNGKTLKKSGQKNGQKNDPKKWHF